MNYQQAINYLFNSTPLFQQVGKEAYKEGLQTTLTLDEHFGHPHRRFRTIHIAGTNGKGSCSHTLAAILQSAGYKTGLYTSPHLTDFRERIRVNGKMISESFVTEFVNNERSFFEPLHPSFFELTTALAFKYFAEMEVDVAVIEVGLGGRLDCTNIISPDLSIITNISFDHTQFLGHSLAQIASEKAGIIKANTPVVIGETTQETRPVFAAKANEMNAPIIYAEEEQPIQRFDYDNDGHLVYQTHQYPQLISQLTGLYQTKNANTILTAVDRLQQQGYRIEEADIRQGFAHVCDITGFMGRWQQLQVHPTLVCDAGHNLAGIREVVSQLEKATYNKLHIVIGMVNDKDISGVLGLLPHNATYYFTKASVKRALDEHTLQTLAGEKGLYGQSYPNVAQATSAALNNAGPDDLIFVGGSCFIVADLLSVEKENSTKTD